MTWNLFGLQTASKLACVMNVSCMLHHVDKESPFNNCLGKYVPKDLYKISLTSVLFVASCFGNRMPLGYTECFSLEERIWLNPFSAFFNKDLRPLCP